MTSGDAMFSALSGMIRTFGTVFAVIALPTMKFCRVCRQALMGVLSVCYVAVLNAMKRPESRVIGFDSELSFNDKHLKISWRPTVAQAIAFRPSRARKGFSLVELSVVVIIIGVLAAFGVPRLLQSVERSKASESFKYLASVRAAQERFQARQGTYASDLTQLDMEQAPPKYFSVGTAAAGGSGSLEDSWTLTLTRSGSSSGYGAYTVTFTEDGYDSLNSTIDTEINPQST